MANFCIIPKNVDKFKQGLISGEISPEKLSSLTSDERRTLLEKYVGAQAKEVNAEFESKLLLKNQQAGMINWAKNVGGISKQTRMDIIGKIERMENILDPKDANGFLSDLAERRLGVKVSDEQAKTIMDLSRQVTEANTKQVNGSWVSEADRLDYGRKVFDMTEYVNDLKGKAKNLSIADFKSNPLKAFGKLGVEIAGNAKAFKASLDNSALLRQGLKTLWTQPKIWAKNAQQSFINIAKSIGGKNVKREITADIISRPNYDMMKRAGLAVGNLEEAFPTTLPEKIPGFGRLFKASEDAYTGFIQKTRADVFDKYIDLATKQGVDLSSKKELEAIGNLVNSLTGRGRLGKIEPAAGVINNVFFSPRFVKANLDTVLHPITAGSAFARKQASINLLKIAAGTATVLGIANALQPGSVEWDPRSADFGKIRIGDTRFDVTGGMSSLATLAARLATQESKSASTGIVSKLNTGEPYSRTSLDVLLNFSGNKLSPIGGVLKDLMTGEDYSGNKITVGGEVKNLLMPMIISSTLDAAENPNSVNFLISMLADGLGIAVNTYSAKGDVNVPSWTKSTGETIKQFKNKVGEEKFIEAAKMYDNAYNGYVSSIKSNPKWKTMSAEEQKALLSKEATQLQNEIFKEYGFKYKYTPSKTDSSLLQSLNKLK